MTNPNRGIRRRSMPAKPAPAIQRAAAWVFVALLAIGVAPLESGAAGAAAPRANPARRFAQRVANAGRAEARFSRSFADPLAGRAHTVRGEIAVEPPDRVSLSFPATGERIVVRSDGGEWLQPGLRQMLTLDRERAGAARRVWNVLLGEDGDRSARRAADGRWQVTLGDSTDGVAETAWVTFDGAGSPVKIEVEESGTPTVYGFTGWRFAKPRGRAAFVLKAPAGYEVVTLP